jgi:membrane fusion protein (multidrug efflux system)
MLGLTLATAVLGGCAGAPVAQQAPAPVPDVAVISVRPERIVLTTELPGRTAPFLIAEIRPQVNGILQQRHFVEGADVRAGQLLYQIDPAPYRAALHQAEAALGVSEAGLSALRSRADRLQALVAIEAAGKQDADDAAAALKQAEANVVAQRATIEAARVNLAYTPVKAPISGRTSRSSVTVGALVTAYQPTPLTVVQQLDPIYVDVTQSSADMLRLQRRLASGQVTRATRVRNSVQLLLEDGTTYPHRGTLQFREASVDPTTGSFSVRLVFPNPDRALLPGMFVRAVVEEGTDEDAILVPQQGLTRNARGDAVALVIDDAGTVSERALVLDRAIGDRWLVEAGLAAGDRVIVDGVQRVRPGTTAKAVPFAATPAPSSAAMPAPSPAAK